MSKRHVIVDGSNLATEGRSMPSLAQLDEAVKEFLSENPTDDVTVVVDASFGHRIDPSEVPSFEAAEEAGEVVSPPAGAIGRGDAFLLRIAEKVGATVLSNDSFQEFHAEHPWLFDKGRLLGGKPVPGVGWIFMERTPVRGAKSREVVSEAKRRKKAEGAPPGSTAARPGAAPRARARGVATATLAEGASLPTPAEGASTASPAEGASTASPAEGAAGRRKAVRPKALDRAIASATKEVTAPGARRSRRRTSQPPSEPVNEPLAFITFVAAHPLSSEVVGTVVEYSSHGAFVEADGARCYIPLSAMGDPPPRRSRQVLTKGEARTFVVQAFDPQRRGVELALPGLARISGEPTPETVEAEIHPPQPDRPSPAGTARRRSRKPKPADLDSGVAPAVEPGAAAREAGAAVPGASVEAGPPGGGPPAAREGAAKKAPAAAKAGSKKAPAAATAGSKKSAAGSKKAPAAPKEAPAAPKEAPAAPKEAPASQEPAPAPAGSKKAPAAAPAGSKKSAAGSKKAPAAPKEAPAAPKKAGAVSRKAAAKNASLLEEPLPAEPPRRARGRGLAAADKAMPVSKALAGTAPAAKKQAATKKKK